MSRRLEAPQGQDSLKGLSKGWTSIRQDCGAKRVVPSNGETQPLAKASCHMSAFYKGWGEWVEQKELAVIPPQIDGVSYTD